MTGEGTAFGDPPLKPDGAHELLTRAVERAFAALEAKRDELYERYNGGGSEHLRSAATAFGQAIGIVAAETRPWMAPPSAGLPAGERHLLVRVAEFLERIQGHGYGGETEYDCLVADVRAAVWPERACDGEGDGRS